MGLRLPGREQGYTKSGCSWFLFAISEIKVNQSPLHSTPAKPLSSNSQREANQFWKLRPKEYSEADYKTT